MRAHTLRRAISIALFATAVGTTSLAVARSSDGRDTAIPNEARDAQQFELAPGSLAESLDAVGAQSGRHIVYSREVVANRQGRAVHGRMHWRNAIAMLLHGNGLDYREAGDGTVVIEPALAAADRSRAPEPEPVAARAPQGTNATDLETITVTGTRIRGGTTPSPVITLGSERIREEGFADLGEVIRSVPQNFGGGHNPGVAVGATSGAGGLANQNLTGGSSLNLRGLGPDATLTLLNGRRMAYGGFGQAVDIGAIPVEAVERIDLVPDGASAIYGSDAVGGVGNVILKRDYDGLSVGARYSGATDGGLSTREYTATAGTTWVSGGFIATLKDTSSNPLFARQRDYTAHMFDPTTLYPGIEQRSALLSAHQSLTDSVELRVDALKTWRDQEMYPWNTGLQPVYYRTTPESTAALVSSVLDVALAGDWTLSLGAGHGRDRLVQHQSGLDIATGAASTLIRECYCNEALSYELDAEGPLFEAPGGESRIAVGIGGRRNEFFQHNQLTDARVVEGEERSRFAYVEMSVPLAGEQTARRGLRRLELTAALRGEDYDSFGRVTTPKLGVIYAPVADMTFKASWGKSFKAPALFQQYQARTASLSPVQSYGGVGGANATVLSLFGGNGELQPERATTWAASLAVHPAALAGFESELTWFDIDYTDRVVQPITDYGQALVNPNYAQFIDTAPTPASVAALLAAADAFYNLSGQPFDPDDVQALLYAQYVNVARQRIRGIDLSASYRFDLADGRMTVRGAMSWLDSTQQNSASQTPFDVAGTMFNPAKLNARLGAVWSCGGLVASSFVNHVAGVTDLRFGSKASSFTTVDANVRFATQAGAGALSGLEFGLSVQNLLDRSPPFYIPPTIDRPPYDSTNYSAIGRLLSASVTKHW